MGRGEYGKAFAHKFAGFLSGERPTARPFLHQTGCQKATYKGFEAKPDTKIGTQNFAVKTYFKEPLFTYVFLYSIIHVSRIVNRLDWQFVEVCPVLDVDVLVVGGGPAGSSLGYMLQQNNIRSCIVEKQAFPRAKLCGGLLTEKTVELINKTYDQMDFPCERITSNLNLHIGTHCFSSITADSKFYLVERMAFDNWLIKKYKEAGGLLFENASITSIDLHEKIAVIGEGSEIRFKILVGADGANSKIRKYLDKKYHPNALCLEYDLPGSPTNDSINIYFSAIRSGYGWCFPKQNHTTVGIGGAIEANRDMKTLFRSFAKSIGKEAEESKIKGALIPFGKYVKNPCGNNIILIGDAAGFVDPITGEGIYFAIYSAKCAFEAVNSYLHQGTELDSAYLEKIRYIQKRIDDGNRFSRSIFFRDLTRPFFINLIDGRKNISRYVCDHLIAHYNVSYSHLVIEYYRVRRQRKANEKRQRAR